jgi:hypothetical protein
MNPTDLYDQLITHCKQIFFHNNRENFDSVFEMVGGLPVSVNNVMVSVRYKTDLKQFWDIIQVLLNKIRLLNHVLSAEEEQKISFILDYLEQDAKKHHY